MLKIKNINFRQVLSYKKAIICSVLSILMAIAFPFNLPFNSNNKAWADPKDIEAELDSVREELELQQESINSLQVEANNAENKVNELQQQINDTQSEIDQNNVQLCSLAVRQYKVDPIEELFAVLDSKSFVNIIFNAQTIDYINKRDAAIIYKAISLKQELENAYAESKATADLLEEKLSEHLSESNKLQSKVDDLNERLAEANKPVFIETATTDQAKVPDWKKQEKQAAPGPAPYLGSVVATALAICNSGGYSYVYGTSGPTTFDCSGFVSWCYGGGGRRLWCSGDIYNCTMGWYEVDQSEAVPGDVIATPGHVAIYIGGGQMAEAACPERGLCISSIRGGKFCRKG